MEQFRELAKDDFKRGTLRLPDELLQDFIHRSSPGLSSEQLKRTIKYMKEQQAQDPLALLQPMPLERVAHSYEYFAASILSSRCSSHN